jgi:hypothetical protein
MSQLQRSPHPPAFSSLQSMHQPGHGPVEHSTHGSPERHTARGFTASYGWASGNPHHVPRFHMSGYQRPVARVDQKYGEHCVVRAPYASDITYNDLPVHNHIPNAVPQFHMSCYERGANVHPPQAASPYLPQAEGSREPPVSSLRGFVLGIAVYDTVRSVARASSLPSATVYPRCRRPADSPSTCFSPR